MHQQAALVCAVIARGCGRGEEIALLGKQIFQQLIGTRAGNLFFVNAEKFLFFQAELLIGHADRSFHWFGS